MPISSISATPENCCAIIITYNAEMPFFEHLQLICEQFSNIAIIDNNSETTFQAQLKQFCLTNRTIKLIRNTQNFGIAAALNQGIHYAITQKFDWVITFDQDTVIYPELFSELAAIYEKALIKPVMIGCNYFHEALNRPALKITGTESVIERRTLITSGTLMSTKLFENIGFFREDYFIDSVDHEFCLRARRHSFRPLMSTKVLMRHSIGRMTTHHRPSLFRIPEHSALRKYYITRNCLMTVFSYYRTEPEWCLKQFARLSLELSTIVFYERAKFQKIAAMSLGLVHACLGKMGELTNVAWIIR